MQEAPGGPEGNHGGTGTGAGRRATRIEHETFLPVPYTYNTQYRYYPPQSTVPVLYYTAHSSIIYLARRGAR